VKKWSEIPLEQVLPDLKFSSFERSDIQQRIKRRSGFSSDIRETLVKVIAEQYRDLLLSEKAAHSLASLKESNTFTICTGQQIVTAGGPWMILLKIATVIQQARYWNQRLDQNYCVPIFWMATEDHDWAEIANIHNGSNKLQWRTSLKGPVGRMPVDAMLSAFDEWNQLYPEWSIHENVLEIYRTSENLSFATRQLIHQVFGSTELLILDPDHHELKRFLKPLMKKELTENWSYEIMSTNGELNAALEVKKGNLFYLGNDDRKRIEFGTPEFNNEWVELMEDRPQDFSPGVVLRPLYQEIILPNLMYVGGPAECKYWDQLKPLLEEELGISPIVMLRERAWLIPEKIIKKWEKANWPLSQWTWTSDQWDAHWKSRWKSFPSDQDRAQITALMDRWEEEVRKEDSTLAPMIAGEKKKWLNGIEMIQSKVIKSRKQRDEVEGAWFQQWQQTAFPMSQLQERQQFWIWEWQKQNWNAEVLIDLIEAENPSYKIWQI
jgi:bacillithiol synthase